MIVFIRRVKTMNKHKLIYFIKQKLCGLILTAIGCAVPFLLDGDATVSIILIPTGLFLIFTRDHIMEF